MKLSRQFRRRMERLREDNIRKYGSERKCFFDEFPCERKPSPIDGDRECGGVFYFDLLTKNGEEEEIASPCSRNKFEK